MDEELLHVRVGIPADLDGMMEIGLQACVENGFVNVNPYKLLQDIYPALHQDHGVVGIIGEEMIEGAVLLRIGTMFYSDDPVLEERAIFVHPQYRQAKGGRAARLCEFSKHVSDELGIPLTIGVLSNERTAAKIRMYRRILGEPTGAYWLHNARTGQSTMGGA